MSSVILSGLVVQPIALRIEEWLGEGKLSEDDLERALGHDARAVVEHGIALEDGAPIEVAESLVALAAAQLGGETGLVEWAQEIVDGWRESEQIGALIERARTLVDGPGFLASQASETLLRDLEWRYEGGRGRFAVHLLGIGSATPELRALLGSLLARLAELAVDHELDVRFSGVDEAELVIFAECLAGVPVDPAGESRLLRAALVGGG